jgi:hypothetical protein
MNALHRLLALTLAAIATDALATFHTFRIEQLYSNADGSVQYVLLRESQGFNGENLWHGINLQTIRNGLTPMEILFPSQLPDFNTAYKYVLVATEAFAALGLIKPDFIIPSGFLGFEAGGQIGFGGVDGVVHPALPVDGASALFRNGDIGPAVAHNFKGESASIKVSPPASTATAIAVEYYYEAWNHYFMTAFPAEVALLDGGAYGGVWKRTGQLFNVWPEATATSSPTCRFFSTSFAPRSSHFYTPFPGECTTVKGSADWQYENIAFHIEVAGANGTCSSTTTPLYRLYNGGMSGAPNHRYTTSLDVFNAMRVQSWVPEGDGTTFVFACVPR